MAGYVEGFFLSVLKKHIEAERRSSRKALKARLDCDLQHGVAADRSPSDSFLTPSTSSTAALNVWPSLRKT